MNEPFFSIIIPSYNREHLVVEAIESVLKQDYGNYEIIVVDDGSTDNTENVLKGKYQQLDNLKYVKQKNAERGAARNKGMKIASGKYITYFDSDDIMYSNHLRVAYEVIKKNNDPEIFHLNYEISDDHQNITGKGKVLNGDYANRLLIRGNFLSCNGVIIRKDVALENMFIEDRQLSAMEDWELWLRMASKYQILYIDTITTAIRNHDSRSVVTGNLNNLITRVQKLIEYVTKNDGVAIYYKKDINKFISSCYTYVSLHIALSHKNKLTTIKYLTKGLFKNPLFVFEKRFLAIIKHLLYVF